MAQTNPDGCMRAQATHADTIHIHQTEVVTLFLSHRKRHFHAVPPNLKFASLNFYLHLFC